MFGGIMPREGKFFELFGQMGDLIVQSATEFRELLSNPSQAETRAREIKRIEHDADGVTHKTIELLHLTFITPLDREDIHQLISRLDDIVDFIEAAAVRVNMYDIKRIPPEAVKLADICVQAAKDVKSAVEKLDDLSNPKDILSHCVEINRLENEADHILRAAMAKLFREEEDTRELIKVKEVYELLETVTDRCEDVANIVDGIILEYA